MNLTKLFNFNYLKENLKKSKGMIALLILVVPVLTLLFSIMSFGDEVAVSNDYEISIINCIGLYIIPVLLSLALFGYVYKKTSVDFINSQPINRKTIFLTNTLGGIILITIIQVLTAIILLLVNTFFSNVVIFPHLIFDIFIVMWVSYAFVFLATNIAMSLSGTFFTQIVLTMLILFLIPFCMDTFDNFEFYNKYSVEGQNINNIDTNGFARGNEYTNYTMPYQILHMMVTSGGQGLYETISIIKMVVLGTVYLCIGLYLFQRRKMENNEESFSNVNIHSIVKALTMIPMIVFLNLFNDVGQITFLIGLIAVYYFVYDFVVRRKVKLRRSIISLILTIAILQLGYSVIEHPNSVKYIKYDDINSLTITSSNSYRYYVNPDIISELEIKNKEAIKILFDSHYNNMNLTYIQSETSEVQTNDAKFIKSEQNQDKRFISLILNMKNGKKISMSLSVNEYDFDKVLDILASDKEFTDKFKDNLLKNGALVMSNQLLENDDKILIDKEFENKVKSVSFKELMNAKEKRGMIEKKIYQNHEIKQINIPTDFTEEIFKFVAKSNNEKTIQEIEKWKKENNYLSLPNVKVWDKTSGVALDYFPDEIHQLIDNTKNEEFDPNKEYYVLNIYAETTCLFFTNKVNEVDNLIKKEREKEAENEVDDQIIYNGESIMTSGDEMNIIE